MSARPYRAIVAAAGLDEEMLDTCGEVPMCDAAAVAMAAPRVAMRVLASWNRGNERRTA